MVKCKACHEPGKYSILLTAGFDDPNSEKHPRFYLPNQTVREENEKKGGFIHEVWFCHNCMRALEDNFRATLLYLQAEHDVVTLKQCVLAGFTL